MLPAAIYGLRVPAGFGPIPAAVDFPATFRVTMAAIDPSAEPRVDDSSNNKTSRATLRLIRIPVDDEEDDDDDDDDDEDFDLDDVEAIKARLRDNGVLSDDDLDLAETVQESEVEKNGGPSDPAKSRKAKQEALSKKLKEELDAEEMDLDHIANGINGKAKGKAKALAHAGSDEDDDEGEEVEEFVICTLDPEKNYQQPLDITIGEHEQVYFSANGTHDIFITGNYVIPPDDEDDYDSDEMDMDYDLSPDEDELEDATESEDDVLDTLRDPRVTEVDSDEEDVPKLVASGKKGKNKRPADSYENGQAATLDELISRAKKPEATTINGEQKLDKKQAKKLKKNDGQAVAITQEPATKEKNEAPSSDKKRVQFAKNLEQGPTGSPRLDEGKKHLPKSARVVQGVKIEDKKQGKGRAAKKGDRIEMRYIGKLKNGKQFDANKKGKPFSFQLGVGEVIKGWDIGVAGMSPGSERRIHIPPQLAYGNRALPDIPANSELVFDIKCISVS